MINFDNYLNTDYTFYLEGIQYRRLQPAAPNTSLRLACQDHLDADTAGAGKLKLTFTRKLTFEPAGIYELTVSYGAAATISAQGLTEVDWKNINVADEIRKGNCTLLNNLISRTSLQIGQITSSSGQAPVITPPGIARPRQ